MPNLRSNIRVEWMEKLSHGKERPGSYRLSYTVHCNGCAGIPGKLYAHVVWVKGNITPKWETGWDVDQNFMLLH